MSLMETHCAAMAAALDDAELIWRIEHMPEPEKQSQLDQAVIAEAESRGLLERYRPKHHPHAKGAGDHGER